jgi:hypothetical protein
MFLLCACKGPELDRDVPERDGAGHRRDLGVLAQGTELWLGEDFRTFVGMFVPLAQGGPSFPPQPGQAKAGHTGATGPVCLPSPCRGCLGVGTCLFAWPKWQVSPTTINFLSGKVFVYLDGCWCASNSHCSNNEQPQIDKFKLKMNTTSVPLH